MHMLFQNKESVLFIISADGLYLLLQPYLWGLSTIRVMPANVPWVWQGLKYSDIEQVFMMHC